MMLPEETLFGRIALLIQWQVGAAIVLLAIVAWLVNVALRKRWNPSRDRIMAVQLMRLRNTTGVGLGLWLATMALRHVKSPEWLSASFGFLVLVAWLVVGLRVGRVLVLEWLFAASLRQGVPLLLVDLFTFGASIVSFGVLLHAVFLVEFTSILATSALASVVLGLAMQDTLGHLFAGISLQLDRPFRLGDWIEVRSGSEKISGQVLEVSWRATLLLAVSEELITMPNKMVAQGLVLNFSGRDRPFVRSHLFRIPLDAPLEAAKEALVEAARLTDGVVESPAPLALVIETTDSWVAVKLVTFIVDYGNQFTIGDAVQSRALALLGERGIDLAAPRLLVERGGARGTPADGIDSDQRGIDESTYSPYPSSPRRS